MWLRSVKPMQYLEALGKFSKSPWLLQTSTFSDIPLKKSKLAPLQERKMIDRCRLRAKGGDGGNGCTSFRRSRHDRRGRPDGMNAKRGGHGVSKNMIGSRGADKVVLVPVGTVIHLVEGEIPSIVEKSSSTALDPWDIPGTLDTDSPRQTTTSNVPTEESANLKQPTRVSSIRSFHLSSPSTKKSTVHVEDFNFSKETTSEREDVETDDVSETEWEETEDEIEIIQYNVAELTEPGQRVLVAQGGDGGLGNLHTPRPSKNPNLKKAGVQKDNDFDNEALSDDQILSLGTGLPGSEAILLLELKSIADVGLVGMPNAGKSTLLGAISRAKPTVGHYAFTTLRPNLGNLNYDDFSVTVADIPGIIRGAHQNRGLGHAFLRHIERTKVLAYVVDLGAALDGRKGIPPWEQLKDLIMELEFYQEGLSDRPSVVVANKIDEAGAEDVFEELKRRVSGVPVFSVCAVLEEGVAELKAGLRMLLSEGGSDRLVLDDIQLD
ncbi:hypothetical protein LguiA_020962 [Lonicera macranthoides]